MPHRYAVLWEPGPDKALPVGLAVEQEGFVLVEVRADLALPTRYDQPFLVRGPDMTTVTYGPKEPQYFDQVLLDLSRSLIVVNEGSVAEATQGRILNLLQRFVLEPLRRERQVVYCDPTETWPSVRAYQDEHYQSDASAARPSSRGERSTVRHRGRRLVAA